jgi:hypothetical protein
LGYLIEEFPMAMIPAHTRVAFENALGSFHEWADGRLKTPQAYLAVPLAIEDIFQLVSQYSDDVDDGLYRSVADWAEKFQRGAGLSQPCDGPAEKTYKGIAECLLRLCRAKEALYVP